MSDPSVTGICPGSGRWVGKEDGHSVLHPRNGVGARGGQAGEGPQHRVQEHCRRKDSSIFSYRLCDLSCK